MCTLWDVIRALETTTRFLVDDFGMDWGLPDFGITCGYGYCSCDYERTCLLGPGQLLDEEG